MIICTKEEEFEYLLKYSSDACKFLQEYEWLANAYVSDFFFRNYWNKLPESWRHALKNMCTGDIAFLLNAGQTHTRQVLPLSLLCYRACVHKYSADRHPTKPGEVWNQIKLETTISDNKSVVGDNAATQQKSGTLPPVGDDGKLHAFYKKHVKPKKQHEIVHLGQAIKKLSDEIGCGHVVDVGSGLGHLARLLSFGHGLRVTSIEAADSHAPKADKYDREIEREIKKKIMVANEAAGTTATNQRPVHVTSMIHADTSMADFLAIIKQSVSLETADSNIVSMATTDSSHGYNSGEQHSVFPEPSLPESVGIGSGDHDLVTNTSAMEGSGDHDLVTNTSAMEVTKAIEVADYSSMDEIAVCSITNNSQLCQGKSLCENLNSAKRKYLNDISSQIPEKLQHASCNSKTQQKHVMVSPSTANCECDSSGSSTLHEGNACQTDHTGLIEANVHETTHNVPNMEEPTECRSRSYKPNKISENCNNCSVHEREIAKNYAGIENKTGFDTACCSSNTTYCSSHEYEQTEMKETDLKTDNISPLSSSSRNIQTKKDTDSRADKISPMTCSSRNIQTLSPSSDTDRTVLPSVYQTCSNTTRNVPADVDSFILAGLHACGDLTSTFLRFFVNCPLARGLASVGCCYMKLTDESSVCADADGSSVGYPMSESVRTLPNHKLSYQARELACHFADTYSQRLNDDPPHLRIHCYRAVLEWVANRLEPHFQRSALQIPARKTNNMDFESYARLGLQKLGICPDRLTPDLLGEAQALLPRWKDVVAFYTLRIALAPALETLLLIDRMLYLYEHGINSILVPVFDPKISPRNFALIAWKTC